MGEPAISFNGLEFRPFAEQDIEVLTPMMKRAFDYDTKIHTGMSEGGPPGYNNGDIFRQWYFHKDVKSYKVLKDGKPIGGLALFIYDNNINYLGNIFIDPDLQGQGIGSAIWSFAEHTYPGTVMWRTDTIWFSKRNHYFYVNKCGFKITYIKNPRDIGEPCSYCMEKEMAVEADA